MIACGESEPISEDSMKFHPDEVSDGEYVVSKRPWWEPYIFTAFVFAGFIVLLILFGYVASIPVIEPVLFGLITIAAIIEAFRKRSGDPSVVGNFMFSIFLGLASAACFSKANLVIGTGYAVLCVIWLCLSINAGYLRRTMNKDRQAKLDRAVATLGCATQDQTWPD